MGGWVLCPQREGDSCSLHTQPLPDAAGWVGRRCAMISRPLSTTPGVGTRSLLKVEQGLWQPVATPRMSMQWKSPEPDSETRDGRGEPEPTASREASGGRHLPNLRFLYLQELYLTLLSKAKHSQKLQSVHCSERHRYAFLLMNL